MSARELREVPGETLRNLRPCQAKRKRRPGARKRVYLAALKSPHWRRLRREVFERAGGTCERPGCANEPEELAHLTYERLGEELPGDVEAQCGACNGAEREQRIARHVFGGDGT